ncbi:MAG: thioesterase family protein [Burkholderiaceae bacterium]|nr:thioesterase family protein [Burkholderiaceae bacterium]
MHAFDEETRLDSAGKGLWRGRVDSAWNIGTNPNGGYLMSLAMATLGQLAPQHPDPLSISAHFLRPGLSARDCTVEAAIVRAGRSLSTARATLMQDGQARIEVLAALGELGQPVTPVLDVSPPEMPPPEACVARSGEEQGVDLPILRRIEVRLHPDEARAGAAGQAQVTGWIRFRDGRPPDTRAVVLFADAFPPAIFGLLGLVGWVPTLELTVHVRRRPDPGWILGRFRTSDLSAGRMVEDGMLWDERGNLVAQSRQLALVLDRGQA